MALNWYIDAWAPTEGIAFASRRLGNRDPWSVGDARVIATLAIAAPDFHARPVDRSVAFGAVHRGFQEQFSIDGQTEVRFASLEALIDLVRRSYLGSGPGTMGGGEGPVPEDEPPNSPAPRPRRTAPKSTAQKPAVREEFFAKGEDSASVAGLLRALDGAKAAERPGILKGAMTPPVRMAAAYILVDCAGLSLGAGGRDAYRIADAGADLTDAPEDLENLQAAATFAIESYLKAFDPPHPRRPELYAVSPPPRALVASEAPLTRDLVAAHGLPPKVRTMLDLLSHVAADRKFLVNSSRGALLPLLLALAANFRSSQMAGPLRYLDDGRRERERDHYLNECCGFLSAWLPVHKLPASLEEHLHQWCSKDPREQRGEAAG